MKESINIVHNSDLKAGNLLSSDSPKTGPIQRLSKLLDSAIFYMQKKANEMYLNEGKRELIEKKNFQNAKLF